MTKGFHWRNWLGNQKSRILLLWRWQKNLTCALHNRLRHDGIEAHTFGVDLDPLLVQRAVEANASLHPKLSFAPLDLLGPEEEVDRVLQGFLDQHGRKDFDLICVFSVTMWVHLHHGDLGLRSMLHKLAKLSRRLLVEPQPWKCYKTAERRAKRAGEEPFPALKGLEIRGPGVEQGVLDMCKEAGMEVEEEYGETKWSRRVVLMKNNMSSNLLLQD